MKTNTDFVSYVEEITSIERSILLHRTPLSFIPISTRMRWAANRKTRRFKDEAYCLMGLFRGTHADAVRRGQRSVLSSPTRNHED